MVCRQVERLLVRFLEGELSEKIKADVSAHLEGCSKCRKERDYLLESWQMLDNLRAPKLKEDFTSTLMRRIHSEQAEFIKVGYKLPRFVFRPLVPVFGSVFVVVLVFLLFWKKPEEVKIAEVMPQEPVKAPQMQIAENQVVKEEPIQEEKPVVIVSLPETVKAPAQSVDNGISQASTQEADAVVVRPPEPIKVATLTNDKEIIQNLDILYNLELLENMNVVDELDVVEDPDSGIS